MNLEARIYLLSSYLFIHHLKSIWLKKSSTIANSKTKTLVFVLIIPSYHADAMPFMF